MKTLIILVALFPVTVFAAVDCGPAKVIAIQSQTTEVLIRIEYLGTYPWKNIGTHSATNTKSFQSIAQQALATDSSIVLRFADGHDCTATNYGALPLMIRIVK